MLRAFRIFVVLPCAIVLLFIAVYLLSPVQAAVILRSMTVILEPAVTYVSRNHIFGCIELKDSLQAAELANAHDVEATGKFVKPLFMSGACDDLEPGRQIYLVTVIPFFPHFKYRLQGDDKTFWSLTPTRIEDLERISDR